MAGFVVNDKISLSEPEVQTLAERHMKREENKVLFDPMAHLCIMPSFSSTLQSSSWHFSRVVRGFLFIYCHIYASAFLLSMFSCSSHCAFATCASTGTAIACNDCTHSAVLELRFDCILLHVNTCNTNMSVSLHASPSHHCMFSPRGKPCCQPPSVDLLNNFLLLFNNLTANVTKGT